MITTQVQVKLNLPLALKEYLESKARKFDMPIAGYVKHLILKDVADMDFPTYQLSQNAEKKIQTALKNKSKAIPVTNLDEYFDR